MLHSLFPRAHRRFLSLPLLGLVADGFDDWLTINGYTQVSRKNSIRTLPHVDAALRHRQVKEVADITTPFSTIVGGVSSGPIHLEQELCGHWSAIWPRMA